MNKRTMFGVLVMCVATILSAQASQYDDLDKAWENSPTINFNKLEQPRPAPKVAGRILMLLGTPDGIAQVLSLYIAPDRVGVEQIYLCVDPSGKGTSGWARCFISSDNDAYNLVSTTIDRYDSSQLLTKSGTSRMQSFTAAAAIVDPQNIQLDTKENTVATDYLSSNGGEPINSEGISQYESMLDIRLSCSYKSTAPDTLTRNCTGPQHVVRKAGNGRDISNALTFTSTYYWWDGYGIYMPMKFEVPLDVKLGDGPWKSQTDSAKLSADDRAQANALFAKGFELYKQSDFTGAKAVFALGLKTDPSNHLAWSALGDINRAAFKASNQLKDSAQAILDYQRVIDLAPTSVEAALAKNYLTEFGLDYKDLGTAPNK